MKIVSGSWISLESIFLNFSCIHDTYGLYSHFQLLCGGNQDGKRRSQNSAPLLCSDCRHFVRLSCPQRESQSSQMVLHWIGAWILRRSPHFFPPDEKTDPNPPRPRRVKNFLYRRTCQ